MIPSVAGSVVTGLCTKREQKEWSCLTAGEKSGQQKVSSDFIQARTIVFTHSATLHNSSHINQIYVIKLIYKHNRGDDSSSQTILHCVYGLCLHRLNLQC